MTQVLATETQIPATKPNASRRNERLFFFGMMLALIVTVFAGFAPSYYLKLHFGTPALPQLVHLHGLVFSAWMVLFLVQTTLVTAGNVRLHRQLGMAGAVVAALMFIVGTTTAIWSAAHGRSPPGTQPLSFLAVPLFDMVTFPLIVGAGFYYRRRPDVHKRLMLLATINVSGAAVARLPLAIMKYGPPAFFGVTDLFLVPCLVFDLATRRRIHPVTLWGGLLLIASQVLRVAISGTAAWGHIAKWLTSFAG